MWRDEYFRQRKLCGKTLGRGAGASAELKGSIVEGPRGGLGVGGWAGPPPLVTGRQVKGGVLSLAHREAIKGFTEGWTPCRGRIKRRQEWAQGKQKQGFTYPGKIQQRYGPGLWSWGWRKTGQWTGMTKPKRIWVARVHLFYSCGEMWNFQIFKLGCDLIWPLYDGPKEQRQSGFSEQVNEKEKKRT